MRNRLAVAAAVLALPFAAATAQKAAPRNVISLQPLSAMLTVYSGEYERSMSKSVTWGLGGTYWDAGDAGDEVKYSSGDFKLRYYPMGSALYGFSVGGTVGYSSVKGTSSTGVDETAGGASVGILLEYQWLMGQQKNFALALGAGAKALMVNDDDISSADFTAHYPTARVSIGWAF